MRLSKAIRKGAAKRPQAFGEYFDDVDAPLPEGVDPEQCSCVLGAAFEAIAGGPFPDEPYMRCHATFLQAEFPILRMADVNCPECGDDDLLFLFNVVTHLNDVHRWTREAIADWVETIERV